MDQGQGMPRDNERSEAAAQAAAQARGGTGQGRAVDLSIARIELIESGCPSCI